MNMKFQSIVLAFFLLFGFSSCDLHKTGRAIDAFTEEYQKDDYEDPEETDDYQEPEQRPAIFYQKLLDVFCCRYYNDCFDREYYPNSIDITNMGVCGYQLDENNRPISWDMIIDGTHSFKGVKTHNNSPFTASVEEIDINTFKVTFYINRYDIFGDPMDEKESATRTMVYNAE